MSELPDSLDSLNRQILAGHRRINGAGRRLGKSWLALAAAAGLAGGIYHAYQQGYLVADDLAWLRGQKTPVGEPKARQPAEASPAVAEQAGTLPDTEDAWTPAVPQTPDVHADGGDLANGTAPQVWEPEKPPALETKAPMNYKPLTMESKPTAMESPNPPTGESQKPLAGKPEKPLAKESQKTLAGEPEKINGLQADKDTREPILVIRKQEKDRPHITASPRPRNRPEAAKAEAKTEAPVAEQAKATPRLVVEEEGVRIIGPEGETFIPIGGNLNGRRILATSPKIGLIITEDRVIRVSQGRAETEAKKDEKEAAMAVQ